MEIIILSGHSGAGKSVALHALEDMGYYCVDNLPISLLPQLVEIIQPQHLKVAISLDIRNYPQDPENFDQQLNILLGRHQLKIIFLSCEQQILLNRYNDSRRLHPLSKQDYSLEHAIKQEQRLLNPLIRKADLIIDTSHLSNHELSLQLQEYLLGTSGKHLQIMVQSFGFKYGLPNNADYIFDVRFLPNPFWVADLRGKTGLSHEVKSYLASEATVMDFIENIFEFFDKWLPLIETNNRSYLTIAIGCTGGKHRSVFVAEALGHYLQQKGKLVKIDHRNLSL